MVYGLLLAIVSVAIITLVGGGIDLKQLVLDFKSLVPKAG